MFVVHSMVLHYLYGIRAVFLFADRLPLGRQDVLVDFRQSVQLYEGYAKHTNKAKWIVTGSHSTLFN